MDSRLELSVLDGIVLTFSIFLVSVGIYFFLLDFSTDKIISDRPSIGVQIDGVGTQKNNGSLFWRSMSDSAVIYDGDKIFANKDRDINLKLLKSNISIKIPKNSMVVISEDNGELVLTLDKGEVEVSSTGIASNVKIKDKLGKTKSIRVNQNSVINLKKSSVNTTVDIKKGSLGILDNKGVVSQNVDQDSTVKIQDNKIEKIQFGEIFVEKSTSVETASFLLLKDGVKADSLSISLRDDMIGAKSFPISSNRLDISKFSPGTYYTKVDDAKLLDKFEILPYREITLDQKIFEVHKGEEIVVSWTDIKNHNFILDIKTPDGKSVTKLTKENKFKFIPISHGLYEFKVSPNKEVMNELNLFSKIITSQGATYYRLSNSKFKQLNINLKSSVLLQEFEEIVDERDDKKTRIALSNLTNEGIKYILYLDDKPVRERSIRNNQVVFRNLRYGKYRFEVYSSPENVKLLTKEFISKDRIISKKIIKNEIKKDGELFSIPFEWKTNYIKPEKYLVEFYKNNLKQPFISKELKENKYSFQMKDLSNITWVIKSPDSSVLQSKTMTLGPFDMIEKLPFIEKTIMKYQAKPADCYEFSLPPVKGAQKYQVEVFKERNMISKIHSELSDKPLICWKSNMSGKFYYRYRYHDDINQISKFSNPGELIFPISPLSEF